MQLLLVTVAFEDRVDHLGRSSVAKNRKNPKKVKCDGRTDGGTDGPTKRGVESRNTRIKKLS